jgi:hypothetical protein
MKTLAELKAEHNAAHAALGKARVVYVDAMERVLKANRALVERYEEANRQERKAE